MKKALIYVSACIICTAAQGTSSKSFVPAIVYQGDRHDQGFNEQAFSGAEQFKKEYGISYIEAQASNDAQQLQALRSAARRGATFVVAVTNTFAPWIAQVAKEFPRVKFVLTDATAKGRAANLKSIMFREQEVAFLAGMAAAFKSKSNTIGYIGGNAIPPILAWGCGYAQGARYAKPQIKIIQNMVANTSVGFSDPARGAEIARSQFDRGVDVVFTAANLTNFGVLRQVKDSGKLGIGVDSNQNGLFPGAVLTSAIKKVGNLVYDEWKAAKNEAPWQSGVTTAGLKENVLDLAIDQHNRAVFDQDLERRVMQARADIVAGKIKVIDYRTDNRCPVKY
ncbi:MAG: BMP family ABC transporter substrate-binding protein [Paludibacterium sp.]|uniref:BMP family lipoprotein n=1 Tax=Paludibacterium sp. TaxID=1917523 RepID=UPI0025E1B1A5|nr:BMP family ABC transporter substrate-binding protein [Paludibacterium sp.]MBV8048590.1 BMP family ABC transporter substrate-binding protein [Paludibacterium sp.]MBV8647940.1 BMP family ABC transporter substrate-binding protein [Paludibacterium sp.]